MRRMDNLARDALDQRIPPGKASPSRLPRTTRHPCRQRTGFASLLSSISEEWDRGFAKFAELRNMPTIPQKRGVAARASNADCASPECLQPNPAMRPGAAGTTEFSAQRPACGHSERICDHSERSEESGALLSARSFAAFRMTIPWAIAIDLGVTSELSSRPPLPADGP
jgi:hypothetical protein